MWDFHFSIDGSDLIYGFDFGAKSAMNTEDIAINDGTKG